MICWGILGAGRMAGWFSTGLQVVEDANRYAIASRTLEKAERFADTYGFQKNYGSYEEMLQDPKVDIVYIATPVREHYTWIKASLEAGKPVLCEKCITVNRKQLKELICLAQNKHLFLMEAMWMKCQPVFRQIQRWVDSDVLGDVRAMDCHFYTCAGKGHRLYRPELAGGALLDLGYYPVSAAITLIKKDIHNITSRMVIRGGVDVQDTILLDYKDGCFADLRCGLGAEKSARLYLVGTKGRVILQNEFFFQAQTAQAVDYDNKILAETEGRFRGNGYEYEAMEAQKCLTEGLTESSLVPLSESLAAMTVLDKCRQLNQFYFPFERENSYES